MAAGRASRRVIQWLGSNLNGATYYYWQLVANAHKGTHGRWGAYHIDIVG